MIYSLHGPPQESPPLLPFDLSALVWDVAIGLLLLSVLIVLLPRLRLRLPIPRRFRVKTALIVIAISVALGAWGFLEKKAAYQRQRNILAEIEDSDGCILVDYPVLAGYTVPDVLFSAVKRVGLWWFSKEQFFDFLDASVGTVVFLQGPPTLLPYVEKLPTLRALDIMDDLESAEPFVRVRLSPKTAPQLERIEVELGQITNPEDIIDLPRLRFLTIRGNPDPESLRVLNHLKNLEYLDLTECWIAEDGIIQFHELTNLRVLSPGAITDATLRSIGKLPHLEELYLETNLTDGGIKRLQDLSTLRKLDLGGCWHLADNDAKTLTRLTELRYLDVSGSSITDAGLKNLASLSRLEELDVGHTRVTAGGLSSLTALSHLRRLDISGTSVDDRIGIVVCGLKELETLNLSYTKITDQGVADLRGLDSLRSLNLSNTKITDRCIAYLLDMMSLREIDLNGTSITGEGAARLQALPELRRLKLYYCPAIAYPTLMKLQKLMPNVDILW